jgi:nicotinate-nucleotide adenylyltransferase
MLADPDGMNLTPAQHRRLHLLDAVHEEVSATELRRRLAAGEACHDMLPAPVDLYIRERGLYAGATKHPQPGPESE